MASVALALSLFVVGTVGLVSVHAPDFDAGPPVTTVVYEDSETGMVAGDYPILAQATPEGDSVVGGGSGNAQSVAVEQADVSTPPPIPADALPLEVPILMYHYVDAEPPPMGPYSDGLTVRTPDFNEEMRYLAENGYHPVTFADLYSAMAGGAPLPDKPVILTFDDGGLDNYTVAYPILKEYGFPATFFVITGKVGDEGYMSWDQLGEMKAGGMDVQSHTRSHPDLRGLGPEGLTAQLVDSRRAIIEKLGGPVQVLCYPSGGYDGDVITAARAAGYLMAVTTHHGTTADPKALLELPRVRIPAHMSPEGFAGALG